MKSFFLQTTSHQRGFTLVETLVAVFILTMAVSGLLTLTAQGFFSVRYARNDIVATALAQETLEYIRNSRDTANLNAIGWDTWRISWNVTSTGNVVMGEANQGCYSTDGCIVDAYTTDVKVKKCQGTCDNIVYFPTTGFYGYNNSYPSGTTTDGPSNPSIQTSYIRTVTMTIPDPSLPDQLIVKVVLTWKNGLNDKATSQSMLLTKWQ